MPGNSRQVIGYIDEDDHRLFRSVASYIGYRHTSEFVGELIIKGLEQVVTALESEKPDELPIELQFEALLYQIRKREAQQAKLNLAAAAQLEPEESEKLFALAEALELDSDLAIKFAETSPFASVVRSIDPHTKSGRCTEWLASLFSENIEMPRTVVMTLAGDKGYKEQMVNSAKRRLGIGHEKRGLAWYWIAPKLQLEVQPSQSKQDSSP